LKNFGSVPESEST